MKKPKIKAGTVILRWNGVSNDKGVVFKITTIKKKKYIEVKFSDGLIRIKKDTLQWKHKYDYDKEKWIYYWKAPAKNVIEILAEKTEGNWIKTYNRAGELVSMKLTDKAHSEMGKT